MMMSQWNFVQKSSQKESLFAYVVLVLSSGGMVDPWLALSTKCQAPNVHT